MSTLENLAKANKTTRPMPRNFRPIATPNYYKSKGSKILYGWVK